MWPFTPYLQAVCASCKAVRDENYHWQNLGNCKQEPVGKSITHTICNSCITKLYPEIAEEVLADLNLLVMSILKPCPDFGRNFSHPQAELACQKQALI